MDLLTGTAVNQFPPALGVPVSVLIWPTFLWAQEGRESLFKNSIVTVVSFFLLFSNSEGGSGGRGGTSLNTGRAILLQKER